jgi:hypothetical protein
MYSVAVVLQYTKRHKITHTHTKTKHNIQNNKHNKTKIANTMHTKL